MTATPEKQWRCIKCNCPYYELLTASIRCAQCGALELTSDHAPTPTPVSRKRVKLPPIGDELYNHYPLMSAQTHESLVKDYARKAVAATTEGK